MSVSERERKERMMCKLQLRVCVYLSIYNSNLSKPFPSLFLPSKTEEIERERERIAHCAQFFLSLEKHPGETLIYCNNEEMMA